MKKENDSPSMASGGFTKAMNNVAKLDSTIVLYAFISKIRNESSFHENMNVQPIHSITELFEQEDLYIKNKEDEHRREIKRWRNKRGLRRQKKRNRLWKRETLKLASPPNGEEINKVYWAAGNQSNFGKKNPLPNEKLEPHLWKPDIE